MTETRVPILPSYQGKLIQLTDLPDVNAEIMVEIEVQVEGGVLPPLRAPAVKRAKPAPTEKGAQPQQPIPQQPAPMVQPETNKQPAKPNSKPNPKPA